MKSLQKKIICRNAKLVIPLDFAFNILHSIFLFAIQEIETYQYLG